MRSVAPMRAAKIGYIVMSLILCVLGTVLIAVPDFSITAVGVICGAVMIVFGIIRLIGYFSKDLYRLAFQYDLTLGIVMIILGAVMLFRPGSLMNFICITLGLYFLADGLFKVQISFDSRSFGIGDWWVILIPALATVVFGALLVARPADSARVLAVLTGISMLCEGILNIITMITAVKIIGHQRPDEIEADFFDDERQD